MSSRSPSTSSQSMAMAIPASSQSASSSTPRPALARSARRLLHRRRSSPLLRQTACPCCGAAPLAWRPIRYGMVALSVYAQARRGEVVIGPVNHGRNEPQWACSACDARFGRPRQDRDRFGRLIQGPEGGAPVSEAVEPQASRQRPSRQSPSRQYPAPAAPVMGAGLTQAVEILEPARLRDLEQVGFGVRSAA